MKKICVFTSNRSEYSRLKSVMQAINNHADLELFVVVAGSHLLFRYGLTKNEILQDGMFDVNAGRQTLKNLKFAIIPQ